MYTDVAQLQADFRKLLNFAYGVDWKWGQDIEQAGQHIIEGVILPDMPAGMGDANFFPYWTNFIDQTGGLPPTTPSVTDSGSGSLSDIFNSISAAINSGANAYATSYANIARAQMMVNAMKAQSQAGFIATPTVIPNASNPLGMGPLPGWLIPAGLLIAALAILKK